MNLKRLVVLIQELLDMIDKKNGEWELDEDVTVLRLGLIMNTIYQLIQKFLRKKCILAYTIKINTWIHFLKNTYNIETIINNNSMKLEEAIKILKDNKDTFDTSDSQRKLLDGLIILDENNPMSYYFGINSIQVCNFQESIKTMSKDNLLKLNKLGWEEVEGRWSPINY